MKTPAIILLLVAIAISGCTKYGNVRLKYPTAPIAYLPENVTTIAVVNRSFSKKDDHESVIESIATGEIAGSDKKASDECLRGIYDQMNGWHKMSIVIPENIKLYGTGTRDIPEMLDWKVVREICDSTKAQALLVLESFDSNSDILASAITNGVNAVMTGNVPPPPSHQVRMNVFSFWRLYYPAEEKIADQFESHNFLTFDAGSAPFPIPPPEALPKTAYNAGEQYIERFFPGYNYVRRDMYKRGKGRDKQQFLAAFRKSEVADWERALEDWKELSKSKNRTNAGRACLDIAVAYEVLGKTNDALIWAKKAYEDYGIRLARDYENQLSYRLRIEY
jgi:hypothetical protein